MAQFMKRLLSVMDKPQIALKAIVWVYLGACWNDYPT